MGFFDLLKNGGHLAKLLRPIHGGRLAQLAVALLSLACVFVWVAFTGAGWVHSSAGRHYGLWVTCYDLEGGHTKCRSEYGGPFWDLWSVVQACGTVSFLGVNAALTLAILYTCVGKTSYNKDVAAIASSICIGTGFVSFCGLLVVLMDFTADFTRDFNTHAVWVRPQPGYCYFLSWAALVLQVLAGMVILRDGTTRRKRALKRSRVHWTELYLT